MDIPNLFLIDQKFLDSYYVIGIDNNSMVLSTEDMGCFTGDCFCCAEDGSDKPKVNMDYSYGLFTYSSENSNYSVFYIKALGLGIYTKNILEFDGDVDSYINVNNEIPSNLFLQYEPPYGYGDGCGFVFGLLATNECGTSSIEVGCHCMVCNAYYVIDCVTQKIKIIKTAKYEDAKHSNPQYIEEFYDLGDVPDINYYKNNGCGYPCHIQEEAACIFNKNSLVVEFSNFEDISEEYNYIFPAGASRSREYRKITTVGIPNLNKSFVFPLYIRACGDNTKVFETNGLIHSNTYAFDWGVIVYSRPLEINVGQLITTVDREIYRYDWYTGVEVLAYESHFTIIDDLIITNYNEIYSSFVSGTATWNDYTAFPPYNSGDISNIGEATPTIIFQPTPTLSYDPYYGIPVPVYCGSNRIIKYAYGGNYNNNGGVGDYNQNSQVVISSKIGIMTGYYAKL